MAHTAGYNSASAGSGLAATLHSNISAFFAGFAKRADYRKTRNELSKMTARELEDVGLSFADIETVARRSAGLR